MAAAGEGPDEVQRLDATASTDIDFAGIDGVRGDFTTASIDHRPPCTQSESRECDIVQHLSVWNEQLAEVWMELRQQKTKLGRLALVANEYMYNPERKQHKQHRCATLLSWLLATHRCIAAVDLPGSHLGEYRILVFDALRQNPFVKVLRTTSSSMKGNRNSFAIVSCLRNLEELECSSLWPCLEYVPEALGDLLTTTTSLQSLNIQELVIENRGGDPLLQALTANHTLKEISLHGSLLRSASGFQRRAFQEYLSNSFTLTSLTLRESDTMRKDILMLVLSCLLTNKTLTKIALWKVKVDKDVAWAVLKVLSQNQALRSFHMTEVEAIPQSQAEVLFGSWIPALCRNETLDEFRIPACSWNWCQWKHFLDTLATKRKMKIVIEFSADEHEYVRTVDDIVAASGARKKVSFECTRGAEELGSPWNGSSQFEACVFKDEERPIAELLPQLPLLTQVTSAFIEIWPTVEDESICSLLASYIQTTPTLQKFHLHAFFCARTSDVARKFWMDMSEPISRNRSLTELRVWPVYVGESVIERVAEACKSSRNIHKLQVLHFGQNAVTSALVRAFAADIASNYVILDVNLTVNVQREWGKALFAVRGTARRNSTLLTQAAQFVSGGRSDRCGAQALDRVGSHVALPERVTEVASVSETEAASMIKRAVRSLQSLDDFMRLAGVVKDSVVCLPREDSRPQLDSLDGYSWSLIRRYLFLDDIATPRRHDADSLNVVDGFKGGWTDCS